MNAAYQQLIAERISHCPLVLSLGCLPEIQLGCYDSYLCEWQHMLQYNWPCANFLLPRVDLFVYIMPPIFCLKLTCCSHLWSHQLYFIVTIWKEQKVIFPGMIILSNHTCSSRLWLDVLIHHVRNVPYLCLYMCNVLFLFHDNMIVVGILIHTVYVHVGLYIYAQVQNVHVACAILYIPRSFSCHFN